MMRIFAISDSDKHFSFPINEYTKRLGRNIKVFNIKPSKHGNHQQIVQIETQKIIEKIKNEQKQGKSYQYILLSRKGEILNTQQFTELYNQYHNATFIIGGPYGFDESMFNSFIQKKISFGYHTMPHGLVKLVLLEQLYRANMIISGKAYHR